ncbi:MAG: cytochrome c oxidase subunit II [Actinomycetota bacterium]
MPLCPIALAFLAACDPDAPSVLDPRGPAARRIEGLWWLMFWISVVVFVGVVGMLAAGLWRRRRNDEDPRRPVGWGEPFIIVAGVVIPAVVLTGVFFVSLRDLQVLSSPDEQTELTIDVVGHDWWWEATYEPSGAVTANEIHIPAGRPVRVRLTTDDVIHSFWVPQLQVKVDMIPGKTNEMWLEADESGRYRGQCAEFCGLQHANMIFYVVAQSPAEFERWLDNVVLPAAEPESSSAARGEDVYMESTCVGCHAIGGTDATATVGPDLTHLADRETLASGMIENNRDSLALWITDPQEVKPGAAMPPTDLSADELSDLLDYLEQLD